MRAHWTGLLALLLAASSARAGAPPIDGEYDGPLGRLRLSGDGTTYRAVVVTPSRACPFRPGEEVLRATLLDDSLAGRMRVCLDGSGCPAREEWASAVLLVTRGGLSGAVHVSAKGCRTPLGARGGVAFARARPAASGRGAATGSARRADRSRVPARERARRLLRDGAAWLSEGNFERARARFLEAVEIDPGIPEAYNGVGVTYRMRDDLARALAWYKRAVAVDPDFGDAYYNMACVYALRGEKDLALRYLQIAAMNAYATAEGIERDPDLAALRGEPGYRALVRAKM